MSSENKNRKKWLDSYLQKSGALNWKLKNKELVSNCEAETVKKKGTSG